MRFLRLLTPGQPQTRGVLRLVVVLTFILFQATSLVTYLHGLTIVTSILAVACLLLIDRLPWGVPITLTAGIAIAPYALLAAPLEAAGFLSPALLIPVRRFRQVALIVVVSCLDIVLRAQAGGAGTYSILQAPVMLSGSASVGMALLYFRAQMERMEAERLAALGAQRTAIARDLHDTLARANTQMVLLAQQALGEPLRKRRVKSALEDVMVMGHRSVSDLRTMLRLLRQDTPTPTAPTPSLTQAMTNARTTLANAGLHATITTDGELTHLPPTITTTLARALDEAVANMTKYAAKDAHCTIIIGATPTQATLLATNPIADHHRPPTPP
ncbi:two-component system sensor histidine kinase [Actinomyces denticolens]|uniref:sensor histidine kinase n=1 Tax=Actinomyces denticolens TaxID=52767 RepID=UPI000981A47E|nr:histidine kinase [Actinomyces denticolens]GAV95084.1 two-component system sensor histidine kinase [Actinomyces denticolens]